MPGRKLPVTAAEMDAMRKKHTPPLTHQELADYYSEQTGERISASAIANALSRAGLTKPANRYGEYTPWRTRGEHSGAHDLRMLRALGKREMGKPLTTDEQQKLGPWLAERKRERQVIGYCPELDEGVVRLRIPDDLPYPRIPRIKRTLQLTDFTLD